MSTLYIIFAVWFGLDILAIPFWMYFISLRRPRRSNIQPTRLSARKLRIF